jgi:hypothetical protein
VLYRDDVIKEAVYHERRAAMILSGGSRHKTDDVIQAAAHITCANYLRQYAEAAPEKQDG